MEKTIVLALIEVSEAYLIIIFKGKSFLILTLIIIFS